MGCGDWLIGPDQMIKNLYVRLSAPSNSDAISLILPGLTVMAGVNVYSVKLCASIQTSSFIQRPKFHRKIFSGLRVPNILWMKFFLRIIFGNMSKAVFPILD